MNNYKQPMIYDNEELAEGVYATGSGMGNCWQVTYEVKQRNTNPYDPFVNIRIQGKHLAEHTSSALEIKILFDRPVSSAVFDYNGFECKASGYSVELKRINHANGYGSMDNFDSNLRIVTEDPTIINISDISWQCVQG